MPREDEDSTNQSELMPKVDAYSVRMNLETAFITFLKMFLPY